MLSCLGVNVLLGKSKINDVDHLRQIFPKLNRFLGDFPSPLGWCDPLYQEVLWFDVSMYDSSVVNRFQSCKLQYRGILNLLCRHLPSSRQWGEQSSKGMFTVNYASGIAYSRSARCCSQAAPLPRCMTLLPLRTNTPLVCQLQSVLKSGGSAYLPLGDSEGPCTHASSCSDQISLPIKLLDQPSAYHFDGHMQSSLQTSA